MFELEDLLHNAVGRTSLPQTWQKRACLIGLLLSQLPLGGLWSATAGGILLPGILSIITPMLLFAIASGTARAWCRYDALERKALISTKLLLAIHFIPPLGAGIYLVRHASRTRRAAFAQ